MRRGMAIFFFFLAGLACAAPSAAQTTMFWNNTSTDPGADFSDPANWTTGFPGNIDVASIQNSNVPGVNPNIWYKTNLGLTPPPNDIDKLWIGNNAEGTVPAGGGWLLQTDQTLNVLSEVVIGRGAPATSWSEYDMSGGTLNVSTDGGEGSIRVSTIYDIIAIFKIRGTATVNLNPSGSGIMYLGNYWGSTGIVFQSDSAAVTVGSGLWLGYFDPSNSLGYYNISGGTLAMNSNGQETFIGHTGGGLFEQSGGSVWVATRTLVGIINPNSIGVLNISGGTYHNNSAGAKNVLGDAGAGILNLSGTGIYSTRSDFLLGYSRNGIDFGTGIINVGSGGTLKTTGMFKSSSAAVGQLNFHGGVIQAATDNSDFFNSKITDGFGDKPVDTYVYPEGGTFDTNGKIVAFTNPLLAPIGNGVAGVAIDYGYWANSYSSPPIVKFSRASGDTTGEGAAGYAVLDANWKLSSIVITNPGVNYTLPPVVTLQGGKYGSWNQVPITAVTLAPNAGTGGFTVIGDGVLAFAGVNTYAGDTVVQGGYLALIEAGQINPASHIINNANFVVYDVDYVDITPHTVGVISGTGTTSVYDGMTLTATSISQDGLYIGGYAPLALNAVAVPEPSILLLLAFSGLGLIAVVARRK
ncbi:MAG: PEP-CTERM sorting domain-containing protein [Pirellulales bacterium]|nr:PEP-CTERM sorting domain-containing protein [Pirellulales bacterium]